MPATRGSECALKWWLSFRLKPLPDQLLSIRSLTPQSWTIPSRRRVGGGGGCWFLENRNFWRSTRRKPGRIPPPPGNGSAPIMASCSQSPRWALPRKRTGILQGFCRENRTREPASQEPQDCPLLAFRGVARATRGSAGPPVESPEKRERLRDTAGHAWFSLRPRRGRRRRKGQRGRRGSPAR